jgi:hypothetical protein
MDGSVASLLDALFEGDASARRVPSRHAVLRVGVLKQFFKFA